MFNIMLFNHTHAYDSFTTLLCIPTLILFFKYNSTFWFWVKLLYPFNTIHECSYAFYVVVTMLYVKISR